MVCIAMPFFFYCTFIRFFVQTINRIKWSCAVQCISKFVHLNTPNFIVKTAELTRNNVFWLLFGAIKMQCIKIKSTKTSTNQWVTEYVSIISISISVFLHPFHIFFLNFILSFRFFFTLKRCIYLVNKSTISKFILS